MALLAGSGLFIGKNLTTSPSHILLLISCIVLAFSIENVDWLEMLDFILFFLKFLKLVEIQLLLGKFDFLYSPSSCLREISACT